MNRTIYGLVLAAGIGWSSASVRAEVPKAEIPVRFSADKPQLLVTAEYMTVEELTEPNLMALLKKHDILVAPCIRASQLESEAGRKELDRLFTAYEQAGIQLVFWPLTPRQDGLYLNMRSSKTFYDYLDLIYQWADEYQHPIQAMIIDIEPLNFQSGTDRAPDEPAEPAGTGIWDAIKAMDRKCFKQAERDFMKIQEKLHAHGTIAISTALDYAALDIVMHTSVWENLAGGPTMAVDWDYVSFMNFGSNNQKFLGESLGFRIEDTRYLSYKLARAVFKKYGNQAGISTGQTLPGEGHGAVWTDPADLGRDVAVLKAAGIMHFGIYDLQGIVQSPDPEAWIVAVKNASPEKPEFRLRAWTTYQLLKKLTLVGALMQGSIHHSCSEPIP